MKKFIKQRLRESLISEDMVSDVSNLALYTDDETIGLYEPNLMSKGLSEFNYDKTEESVISGINYRFNNKHDAYEIDSILAEKGYGPITYLILMTLAGKHGLMPMTIKGQVSDEAKNVWRNFYEGKGSNLVEKIPLESSTHDEEYLNHKYIIKSPIDLNVIKQNHEIVIKDDKYHEKIDNIANSIDNKIRNKMNDMYS